MKKFGFLLVLCFLGPLRSHAAEDVLTMKDVPGSKYQMITLKGHVDADMRQTWAVLTDVARYKEFMPKMIRSDLIVSKEQQLNYGATLNMFWPIPDVEYVCEMNLNPDQNRIDFKMVPGTGKSVKAFEGHWILVPLNENKLELEYTLFFEPERAYPAWIVNKGAKATVGKTLNAIRKRLSKLQAQK